MQKVNNILNFIWADKIARTASVQITDENAADYLAAGEVVITDVSGKVLDVTAAGTATDIVIVQGQGSGKPLIKSPVINKNKVTEYKGTTYTASTEQVTYFGYDASTATGSIDAINDNSYIVDIAYISSQKTHGSKLIHTYGQYTSDSVATQAEIADGLTSVLVKTVNRHAEKVYTIERVSGDAGAAITGTGTTWTVTKGSDKVTVNGTITNVAVGDYVRLGGATVTSPVYKVTAISSGASSEVTLDVAFQGASAAIAVANVEVIVAATAATADFGVRVTGKDGKFEAGKFKYEKTRFKLTARNAGNTTITTPTKATDGIGEYQSILELEAFTVGFEGSIYRIGSPAPTIRMNAEEHPHSLINLHFYDDAGVSVVHNGPVQPKQLIIALDRESGVTGGQVYDGTGAGTETNVIDVLDAFMPSTFTDIASAL